MNPQTMTTVEAVDPVFYFIFGVSVVMLIGITIAMVYFVIRYNRKRCPVPESQKDDNFWLETTWTVIPTIIVLLMFWFGWEGYLSLRRVPDGATPVQATARMWSWLFTYENGKTSDKLYVPVGQPVKIKLTSEDVLHSFFVPAFRVKRDCVPGMETYVWFVAEEAGSYDLFCAEYCGVAHADMVTTVEAVSEDEFAVWLTDSGEAAGVHPGQVAMENYGCFGCHSLDGSKQVGPSFQDIAGRETVVEINGEEKIVKANREYILRAINEPNAEIVKGYPPAMPPYAGSIGDEELGQMADFLLQGDKAKPTGPNGMKLMQDMGCFGCHSTDGSKQVGPSFKSIAGRPVKVEKEGSEQTVNSDRAYLKRAIVAPEAEIVVGFPPAMPTYDSLSAEEVDAIVDSLEEMK